MKKLLRVLALGMLAVLVLVGCGKSVEPEVANAEDEMLAMVNGEDMDADAEFKAEWVGSRRAIVMHPKEESEIGQFILQLEETVKATKNSSNNDLLGGELGLLMMFDELERDLDDMSSALAEGEVSPLLTGHSFGVAHPKTGKVVFLSEDGDMVQDEYDAEEVFDL